MLITKLLESNKCNVKEEFFDINITGISDDSRDVGPGMVFVAIPGNKVNGFKYIKHALSNGARAVICENKYVNVLRKKGIVAIGNDNPRLALSKISSKFYPWAPSIIAAVTGTNGKSSTVHFLSHIWSYSGLKVSSIGTLGIIKQGKVLKKSLTTPNPISLHKIINSYKKDSIEAIAIEASSHGLDQHRLDGLKINIAAMTNITRDHMDYHGNYEKYLKAKVRLFSEILDDKGIAVLNIDQKSYNEFEKVCKKRGISIESYGINTDAKWRIINISQKKNGQNITFKYEGIKYELLLPVKGLFQIENSLCALVLSVKSGVPLKTAISALEKAKAPKGRLMRISSSNDNFSVYIDYAHSPDALKTVLVSLKGEVKGDLILVFGCGGDRDKGKRKLMGMVAKDYADIVYVTDDNPRNEKPLIIREEILENCKGAISIEGRKNAIYQSIMSLKDKDVLLIAGKGHEDYQEIKEQFYYFNDIELARNILDEKRLLS